MDYKERTMSEQTGLYINAISALEYASEKIIEAIQNNYGEEQAGEIYSSTIIEKYNSLRNELFLLMGNSVTDNMNDLKSNEI